MVTQDKNASFLFQFCNGSCGAVNLPLNETWKSPVFCRIMSSDTHIFSPLFIQCWHLFYLITPCLCLFYFSIEIKNETKQEGHRDVLLVTDFVSQSYMPSDYLLISFPCGAVALHAYFPASNWVHLKRKTEENHTFSVIPWGQCSSTTHLYSTWRHKWQSRNTRDWNTSLCSYVEQPLEMCFNNKEILQLRGTGSIILKEIWWMEERKAAAPAFSGCAGKVKHTDQALYWIQSNRRRTFNPTS